MRTPATTSAPESAVDCLGLIAAPRAGPRPTAVRRVALPVAVVALATLHLEFLPCPWLTGSACRHNRTRYGSGMFRNDGDVFVSFEHHHGYVTYVLDIAVDAQVLQHVCSLNRRRRARSSSRTPSRISTSLRPLIRMPASNAAFWTLFLHSSDHHGHQSWLAPCTLISDGFLTPGRVIR